MFQAEIQVQPKEGCIVVFLFNLQSKIVIAMPNWKKAFFPSQVGSVMGIFPLSPYSRKSVSRKVFSYLSNRSNRMFGFFPLRKKILQGGSSALLTLHYSVNSQYF